MHVRYDPFLVMLSILFAIAVSYTALDIAGRVTASTGRARLAWLLAGSFAMGTGIWGMHFVGMMAIHLPVPIAFHLFWVLLSILIAVGASLSALYVSTRTVMGTGALLGGSVCMGLGIAGMHYIGMYAIHANAVITYDPLLAAASVAIAVAASFAALRLAHEFCGEQTQRGEYAKVASGVIMGSAIAGMHYTAMAAARFTAAAGVSEMHNAPLVAGPSLSVVVVVCTFAILTVAFAAAAMHRSVAIRLLESARARESEVRAHQEFLRQVIDANPNLVFVKDWHGRFVLANQALADTYGTTVQALVGKTDADFNPNVSEVRQFLLDDRSVMMGQMSRRISEEPVSDAVGRTRWFQTVKIPMTGDTDESRRVLGVATDITDRKLLEDQLRHAQKMEALGQLTGGIAHDLNNVLTVILANADLLAPHVAAEADEVQGDFKDLQSAASRGAEMVRKLLAFSRRETLRMKPVDAIAFCNDVLGTVKRILPATIDVRLHAENTLPGILADEGALHQMILNLATNARDSMPGGGMMVLDVGNKVMDEEWCMRHGWGKPGRYVCITVSDTGTGMTSETKARIFEPFFTTKALGDGTGLGLPMVYGLVRQHGGYVGVYSEYGQGTAIRLYFPASVQPLDEHAGPAVSHPTRGGCETILIADDEESVRRSTTRVLERHGYRVLIAANGEEALGIIMERGDEIALVISDVVMPRMGGKELHTALVSSGFTIPFLFTSGYAASEVRQSVSLDPSVPFLHKPWAMPDLLEKVRHVMDKEALVVSA